MDTLLRAHAAHLLMEPLHIGCGLTRLLNHVCILLGQPLSSGSSSSCRLYRVVGAQRRCWEIAVDARARHQPASAAQAAEGRQCQ